MFDPVNQRPQGFNGSSVVIENLPVTDVAGCTGFEDEAVRSSLQTDRPRRWRW